MPSKFWHKSSNADPALDLPRSQSRQQESPYNPRPPSSVSYDPYDNSQNSTASLASSSSRGFPPSVNVQAPGLETAPSAIEGFPYEQQVRQPDAANQKSKVVRKSIKSRLLAAAAAKREEPEAHQKESGFFGRKRSIRGQDSPDPSDRKEEASLYQSNSDRWKADFGEQQQLNQDQGPINHTNHLSLYSPDFSTDQLDYQHRHTSPSQGQGHSQNYAPQVFPHLQPGPHQYISSDAQTLPTRPSFESLQASSAPEPNSRPSSRQSHELLSGNLPQSPSRYGPDSVFVDTNRLPALQGQYRNGSANYRAPEYNQHQTPSLANISKATTPMEFSRDQQSGLRADNGSGNEQASSTGSAMMPNSIMGGPSSMVNRAIQPPRDGDSGRRTPPLTQRQNASDMSETDVDQLLTSHQNLLATHEDIKRKYNNVKRQYFLQKEQVDGLQNTLAHQRISQSRTQLDDGEYIKRLTRLDGLVAQLAFSIRKSWASIPEWLVPFTNKDALQLGKQEMTAVGRAFMSRWLANEIFDKFFHPDLQLSISAEFKTIQKNIRLTAPVSQSIEEEEALTAKINNWRLATMDGLRPLLGLPQATANRQAFTEALTARFLEDFERQMADPMPPDLPGGIRMIIELAVGILANLPQESRDVHIEYIEPGRLIVENFMKIETGIPALPASSSDADQASISESTTSDAGQDKTTSESAKPSEELGKKSGFLSGLMTGHKKGSSSLSGAPNQLQTTSAPQQTLQPSMAREEGPARVRMCVFLGMQIRGKMVLAKAPVYRI